MNPPRLSRTSLGKVKQRTGGFMCTGRKCERLRKAYLVALNILAVDGEGGGMPLCPSIHSLERNQREQEPMIKLCRRSTLYIGFKD